MIEPRHTMMEDKVKRVVVLVLTVLRLFVPIGFGCGAAYVAVHFIVKFW